MSTGEERRAERVAAAAAFGRWLLQERELRGLARDEVARLSKLGPAVVDALESGDPDRMPPRGYVVGYLRAYAGAVGLAPEDVVLRWQEVAGDAGGEEEPRRRPRLPLRSLAGAAVAIAAAALVAAVLCGGPRQRAPLKLDRPRAVERAPYLPPPSGR